jgi:sugar/nucleoside kinase (ribokinase family)
VVVDVPHADPDQSKPRRQGQGGAWRQIEAFPEREVDPTGAGDIFAAAFLIRLAESDDVAEATRFASAAASISVGGEGTDSVPTRAQVESLLAQHPEVALR